MKFELFAQPPLKADAVAIAYNERTKIESTVRYLGVEIDDAIEIAEKIDV